MKNRAIVLAICLVAIAAALPSTASAAVHHCSLSKTIHGRLSALATVLTTRDTSCKHARHVVREDGDINAPTDVGDRFKIGGWKCKVYKSVEEDHRARCTSNGRAFRVDYGS